MKKRSLKSLSLNKKSISNLNITGGANASSHPSLRTACLSCTRTCNSDCAITLDNEVGCKEERSA
jgi:hypothetical protein